MNMITRCPACETSFRITEAQLNTAKGAVRCGSCLHIFRALDNLVQPRTELTSASTTPVEKPAEKQPAPLAKPASRPSAPEMPHFEYRRPAPTKFAPPRMEPTAAALDSAAIRSPASVAQTAKPPVGQKTAADWDRELADSDDLMIAAPDWEQSPAEEDFDSEEENENRLRFDQAAIDEDDDSAAGLGTEDILISDEMTLEDETFADTGTSPAADFGDENFLALDSWKTTETSLFDRGPRTPKRSDDYDEDFDPDESWAMDLLEEEEEGEELSTAPASQPQALQAQSPVSDDREPVPEETDEHEDYFDYTPEKTGSFTAIAEESGYVPQPEQAREQQSPIWDDEADYSDEEEQPPLHARDDSDPDYDLFESRTSLLNRIEPEPVEFAIAQSRDWRKTLLWGSLSLAGMLMLIGQVAWLQFDQLSRQQPYRDLYAAVCPLIGCKLPSLAAPDLIRTSNLVVRSHPQAEGALMVDTILLNRASFEQPFPDLVLTFSNIHGQTLAARRFTPSEYLAGELAGQTRMPSNQPIHLSLEIVDPGPDAVNYSAYIPQ